MKKILSLFLASLMVFSLFTSITSFAASQTTDDGGTLWHKWDFETDIVDTVSNITPTNNAPTRTTDSGLNIGKFGGSTKTVAIVNTSTTLSTSTDRYVVVEFDFKRDASNSNCYIGARNIANNKTTNFLSFDKINQDDTNWMHIVVVVDRTINSSSKYGVYTYSVIEGTYNVVDNPNYKAGIASNEFADVRIEVPANNAIYLDNLELKTYPNFYETINSASSAQVVINAIDRFAGMGIVTIPTYFSQLTSDQKLSVATKLLNKNFASDAAVVATIESAINSQLVVAKYYDWDFEDNTLTDSVVGLSFMAESVSATETDLVVAADPTNGDNRVAKIDFTKNGNSRYNDKLPIDSDEFKYITYSFKVYLDGENNGTVSFSTLGADTTNANRVQILADNFSGNEWHDLKIVVDNNKKVAKVYEFTGGNMELVKQREFSIFDPSRIRIDKSGNERNIYYDDFEISGYKDVISTINSISSDDVASTLELYNDIGIVELPASYASLDDSAKAALGAYIKANTTASTTVDALNESITLYLSNDELVVLSSDATASALNALKLAVKKDGVSLVGAKLIVAAYDGTELVSVKVCDVAADGTAADLNVDISSADSVKLMLVNNTTAMVPAVKATAWK